jgi:hypothetical protein
MKVADIQALLMGTEKAAAMWDLTQDHIKKLCRQGKVEAFQIGHVWILLKDQPNPKKVRKLGESDV